MKASKGTRKPKVHTDALPVMLTIGHSTHPLNEFVDMLLAHGVTRVVDVRTVPRSFHNPQFNKTSLPRSLKKAMLGYVHMPGLGGLRHAKRDSINMGWRNTSFRGYADYMQTPEFEESLNELRLFGISHGDATTETSIYGIKRLFRVFFPIYADDLPSYTKQATPYMGDTMRTTREPELIELANHDRIALMCAEAVPWRCHRSLIADALLIRGIRTEDIMSLTRSQVHTLTPFAEVHGTLLTYPSETSHKAPQANRNA